MNPSKLPSSAMTVAAVVAVLAALSLMAPGVAGQDSADAKLEKAVERGLAYLKKTQRADGSWRADVGYKLVNKYMVTRSVRRQNEDGGGHVGVSSLALIAFLAGGHVPGRGPYGGVIDRGVRYVLRCVSEEDGYISENGSRMYSHAFATLCLAEIYGMTREADLRQKLQDAIDLIVKSQNERGSWRYVPFATASDMSITVCQVQALRAARNVGLKVPRSTINRAIDYIKDSAIRDGPDQGAFKYQPRYRTRSTYPLTAAGITALYGAGVYDDDDIERGLNYLLRRHGSFRNSYLSHYFYYYGHYYAVQAMFIAGGEYWDAYFPKIRKELLREQRPDGSWPNEIGPGPIFGTAVACIVLQIPKRYLPIFQK